MSNPHTLNDERSSRGLPMRPAAAERGEEITINVLKHSSSSSIERPTHVMVDVGWQSKDPQCWRLMNTGCFQILCVLRPKLTHRLTGLAYSGLQATNTINHILAFPST